MKLSNIASLINTSNIKNAAIHFRNFGFRGLIRKTVDFIQATILYGNWYQKHLPSVEYLQAQRDNPLAYTPTISIVVPTYCTPDNFLRQMIDSVTAQTYPHWELCIADGSIDFPDVANTVKEYQKRFPNIRFCTLDENQGIAGNTNAALALASGDFITLLDHDDILAPDALYEIALSLNQDRQIDVVYTDEDKFDTNTNKHYGAYFKPDFSLDLLRCCNYITHLYTVRKDIVAKIGGFSSECDGSQDYDFILKTSELARKIHHIPKILYHWRIHPNSVAGDPASKSYAYESASKALENHLARCNEQGTVTPCNHYGYYNISYPVHGTPLVSIICQECSEDFLTTLKQRTRYSSYEIVESLSESHGDYLVFCYHLSDITTENWLEELLGNCQRPGIGLVSGKLFTSKKVILEAGLIFSPSGQLYSPFAELYYNSPGYCYQAMAQHNCSFVSPYCYMIKRELYETHTDEPDVYRLCYNLRQANYLIVTLPSVCAVTKDRKLNLPTFGDCRGLHDPYYNPNFLFERSFQLK